MSFGAEMKDFLSGFKTSQGIQHQAVQDDYYRALTEKAKKGTPGHSGEGDNAVFDLDSATGQPKNENIDTNKPHGMIYNMGKWLGLNGGGDGQQQAVPISPTQKMEQQQDMPMEGYDSMDGYARGGMVRGKLSAKENPDLYDDGAPEADAPPEAVTVSAPRNATGVLQAAANPGVMNDGKPEVQAPPAPTMDLTNRTEAVTKTATREPPHPTPRPEQALDLNDGKPEVTDPYAEKVQVAALPPANTGPAEEDGGAEPAGPESRQVAAPNVASSVDIGEILHGGLMALTQNFGLDHKDGAVPDQQRVLAGQKALMSGGGRASAAEMREVAKAVDPNGELSHSQMMLRAMTKGYEFYMEHGQPQHASNYAAMIIQYATFESAKHGQDAVEALKKGDITSAAKSLEAGFNNIPDGREASNVKVNPDKTVTVTETDARTGKPINQHTLTPQQLYAGALGLANKTASWQALMTAAGSAKGANLPEPESMQAARLKLAGANDDGTLTDAGNGGAPAAQPAQAIPTEAQQPQGQQQGGSAPLGIRTNNPGNLRPGGQQANYETPTAGVLAASANLDSYAKRGINTIAGIINRWAPPNENDTANYTQFVAKHLGVDPNTPLNLADPNVKGKLLEAMFQMENGRQPQLQNASYTQPAGQSSGQPSGQSQPAPQQGQAPAAQPGRPGANASPFALQPALPQDTQTKPNLPSEPQMAQMRQQPKPPKQVSMAEFDTAGMTPAQRKSLQADIVQKNLANRATFNEDMRLWRSEFTQAKTGYDQEHQKYADAVRAAKQPAAKKDPFSLPVKDRTDAMTALKEARPDPADKTDPNNQLFATLQQSTQKQADDLAYALYVHNDTTPQRAYQAAMGLVMPPGSKPRFTAHETSDPNTARLVFRTGDTMLIPVNALKQASGLMGNEHFVARGKVETEKKRASEDAASTRQRKKAVADLVRPAAKVGDYGTSTLN